jgi:Domain of unknown function DUF83
MESCPTPTRSEDWYVPLSAINQFLYCRRRAALIHVEGIFEHNMHTVLGNLAHEHADLPGYEVAKGVKLLRALPVFSDRLGLSGKCDIVEQNGDGTLCPVEYKKGPRRKFINDDAQPGGGVYAPIAQDHRGGDRCSASPAGNENGPARRFQTGLRGVLFV